jgi:hypothetical protein
MARWKAGRREAFRHACKHAKLGSLRSYVLRHAYANRREMAGIARRTGQEFLGHTAMKMILRYAYLFPTHKRRALEALVRLEPFFVEKSPSNSHHAPLATFPQKRQKLSRVR